MRKIVSNSLSPNLLLKDAFFGLLGLPFLFSNKQIDFNKEFQTKNYLLTNSARTALSLLAEKINSEKKVVAIPAFCCGVMATPFLEKGYRIEWIDTDKNGLISVSDFEKKAKKCGVVLVPHIFGQRAPVAKIYSIARKYNIFTIEDCAHLFDPSLKNCDAKIFSFGREKVYSSVSGGALLYKSELNLNLPKLPRASVWFTFRHLLQPLVLSLALPVWNLGGKYFAAIFSKLGFLPRAVTPSEKKGKEDFPKTVFPYALQRLLRRQLNHAEKIALHRAKLNNAWQKIISKKFSEAEILKTDNNLRTIMRTEKRIEIMRTAFKHSFDLKDWEGSPIAPKVDLSQFNYKPGQCPNAEKFAKTYLTFPTNIRTTLPDTERFANINFDVRT